MGSNWKYVFFLSYNSTDPFPMSAFLQVFYEIITRLTYYFHFNIFIDPTSRIYSVFTCVNFKYTKSRSIILSKII